MLTLRFIVAVGASCLLRLAGAQSLADAPQCSTKCLFQAMSQPAFANQSQAELCVDQGFNNFVGGCVQQGCSVVESLIPLNGPNTLRLHPLHRKGIYSPVLPPHLSGQEIQDRNLVDASLRPLVGFIFIVFSFVQRQPTWLIWEGWRDKEPRGVILDLNKMGLSHGGMNIALDVWMLILPLTQLYKLNLKMKKKLGIIAMFSVGVFLTVVSVVRLRSLISFATSANATADARGTTIWSAIEICTGVVVACMPNARQIVRETGRQIKDASANLTNRTHGTNSGSQRVFQDHSLEMRVAVNSSGAKSAPTDKCSYSSTTAINSGRRNSSFTSDAETARKDLM
ncbi:hypothetical protein CCUS01_16659 [Colletotrichum cuscutae]|uniref:Rhodopsin domain-containing protein n=1 Tax=Colletotrichum cuscutae TaxID=1209917 RepID=A0AAI9VEL8_9PEZI|nr:hypothetical protein CCUS01_16659 [Colletotrichum cuscutae]